MNYSLTKQNNFKTSFNKAWDFINNINEKINILVRDE